MKLGVGVIGSGIMGTEWARKAKEHSKLRVLGVSDVVKEKAERLASEVGAKAYTDFREMLKDKDIEIVFVATPDYLHKEPVIEAAEMGKHMWIEKPLATNMNDAKEMMAAIEKAQKRGAKVTVQFGTRWYPFYEATRFIIAEGYVGEPIYASMTISDRIDVPLAMWGSPNETWAKNTTVADFLMCYSVDLMRTISGKNAKIVYARSVSNVLKFTPDVYQALVTFEDDFQTYLESGWILARTKPLLSEHFLTVVCRGGTFQYSHSETTLATYAIGGGEVFFSEEVSMDVLREIQEKLLAGGIISRIIWEVERRQVRSKEMRRCLWIPASAPHSVKHHQGNQFENFIHSILEDEEPHVTAMDGYRAVEVVCAVKESAKSGKIIEL